MWVHKKNCSKNLFVDIFGQLWQTFFLVIVKTSILNVPKKRTGPFTDKPSNRTPPEDKANDTVRVELETGKIMDHVKFETGNLVMISPEDLAGMTQGPELSFDK